jgi:transcriptional regulator with XRE-family HTH domain
MYTQDVHAMTLRHKNLGDWLKYWRKEFRMTQPEVGEAVGVSKQHISNIERQQQHATSGAESKPSIEVVDKLSRLFKRPIKEARILAGYERQNHIDTVEEALDNALFFDQKGLSEADKEKIRPFLEMMDREIERLKEKKEE